MRGPRPSFKAIVCLLLAAAATLVFLHAVRAADHHRPGAWVPAEPTRAAPAFLTSNYVAPRAAVAPPGSAGQLLIPSIEVSARVAAVKLDGEAMAIPNDIQQVGWLESSARADDLVGVSLLSGHVSDRSDRRGALSRLAEVEPGVQVTWIDRSGVARAYRVISKEKYPRASGMPASVLARDGRHRVAIVTCADRIDLGGGRFRYASNLVVTAEAV